MPKGEAGVTPNIIGGTALAYGREKKNGDDDGQRLKASLMAPQKQAIAIYRRRSSRLWEEKGRRA